MFLAVFVPLLIRDIHYAPHDGQGGLGGFVLGVPVAGIAALVSTLAGYGWMVKRRTFEETADAEGRLLVAAAQDDQPGEG